MMFELTEKDSLAPVNRPGPAPQTAPFYSPHLPADVAALIRSPNPPPIHKPSTKVEIRLIDNKEHPAHGQRGLFAKKKLAKGELIIWCGRPRDKGIDVGRAAEVLPD